LLGLPQRNKDIASASKKFDREARRRGEQIEAICDFEAALRRRMRQPRAGCEQRDRESEDGSGNEIEHRAGSLLTSP
jgi:hypothetical protein